MPHDAQLHYEKLTPPLVITSDGEIVAGDYKRESRFVKPYFH